LFGIEEEKRQKAVEEEFAELRRINASPDEHKEKDASLTPAEKARVFRNGLSSRNKVGWIFYEQSYRTDVIKIQASGLMLIQELFEHNPDATPVDLLKIMDLCMETYISQPKPTKAFKRDVQWNTRTGATSVYVFAKNLKAIVGELHINNCPIKHFLGDIHQEQQVQEEPVALAA
jgi:hypothetical protein